MKKNEIIDNDVLDIINRDIPFDKLYGKTILISGANGYVPAYFVYTFLMLNDYKNANITVLALCRNEERAKTRFSEYLERSDFQLLIQDVCEPIQVNQPIHIYIHAASPAGIKSRYLDPVNTFLANVKGCENMLESAIKNPCEHFLFLSSVDIYGKMDHTNRLVEDESGSLDTMNVRNTYSCSKRAAENLCTAYYAKYNLPVSVVRPFQIVGPGPELDDGRLHIDFISQILQGNQIVLKSDGTARRTFLYITDAIAGMLTVMLCGKIGQAYNVVDEQGEASVKELAQIMANCVKNKRVEVVFDYTQRNSIEVTGAISVVTGSSQKILSLGWQPRLSLMQGAIRMMQYYGIETKE